MSGKRASTSSGRARKRIAREYRSRGYVVSEAPDRAAMPNFLRDFAPDIVATKGDDRVVVEIKEARALKGSNALTELAARVAGEEGWRLELVALASDREEPASEPTAERLGQLSERSRLAFARELPEVAFVYAVALVEELVRDLAAQNAVKERGLSPLQLARELAFRGVVSEEAVTTLRDAWSWRNRLMHARQGVAPPTRTELDAVLDLCRSLQSELRLEAAE